MADEAQSQMPPLTSGQTSFTPAQEARLSELAEYWKKVGMRQTPVDRDGFLRGAAKAYEVVGLAAPVRAFVVPSPLAGIAAYGLVSGGGVAADALRNHIQVPSNVFQGDIDVNLDMMAEDGREAVLESLTSLLPAGFTVPGDLQIDVSRAVATGVIAADVSQRFDRAADVVGSAGYPSAHFKQFSPKTQSDVEQYIRGTWSNIRLQAFTEMYQSEPMEMVSYQQELLRDAVAAAVRDQFGGKRRFKAFKDLAERRGQLVPGLAPEWVEQVWQRAASFDAPEPTGETVKKRAASLAADSLSDLTYDLAHRVTQLVEDPVDAETFHSWGQHIQNALADSMSDPHPRRAVDEVLSNPFGTVGGKSVMKAAAQELDDSEVSSAISDGIFLGIANATRDYLTDYKSFTVARLSQTVRESIQDRMENWWKNVLGRYEAGWLGFFLAFGELGYDTHQVQGLAELTETVGWWWPTASAGIVCDRPVSVTRDKDFRLHHPDQGAVKFSDGFSIYAWHGTNVVGDMIEEGWSVEQIMGESNVERRRCAIEKMGWETFIEKANMKRASEDVEDPGNRPHTISLWDLPRNLQDMFDQPARILLCTNGSPERDGTRHKFGLVVPATHSDPVAAAADTFGWPVEAYRNLQVRR